MSMVNEKKSRYVMFGMESHTKFCELTGKWRVMKKTLYILFIPVTFSVTRDIE